MTQNENLGKKLRSFQKNLTYPSSMWIAQQLMHPLASSVVLPTYTMLNIGKILLVSLQKLKALSFPVSDSEKHGVFDYSFVQKLPNALAALALLQLRRVKEYNDTRERIANVYIKKLSNHAGILYAKKNPLLRFPVLVENPDGLISFLRKKNVYVGKWYSEVIDPKGTDLEKVGYLVGSCPVAEKIAKHIVNLPTNPTLGVLDGEKVAQIVIEYENLRNK